MNLRRFLCSAVFALLATSGFDLCRASDHLDAPLLIGNGSADVNDLYAFRSPANPDNTVLILTVNPFVGTASPSTFDPALTYKFKIDNDGDAVADVSYSATFSAPGVGGVQNYSVMREDNSVVASGSTGMNLATSGGGTVTAGLFDDPFFFDLQGFRDTLAGTGTFTGTDAFAGADISAIVLEVPSSVLGGANLGIWATTEMGSTQLDRVGRPAINTALIPSGRKDEFNAASPSNDPATFGADVQAIIEALNGGDSATAAAQTAILLPDVLTIDTSMPSGFLNGRTLADDVIDAELNLLTKGGISGDGVAANDKAFLDVFPYLAAPTIPEPSSIFLVCMGIAFAGRRTQFRRLVQ